MTTLSLRVRMFVLVIAIAIASTMSACSNGGTDKVISQKVGETSNTLFQQAPACGGIVCP